MCDTPFEFPAYGDKGCKSDCGLHTSTVGPLYPVMVLLKGDFAKSVLGSGSAASLASSVTWNLCLRDEKRLEAGLSDVCWYDRQRTVEARTAAMVPFDLPAGRWYLLIDGDYYNILEGTVFDASNATNLRPLTVSPEWSSCEVSTRHCVVAMKCLHGLLDMLTTRATMGLAGERNAAVKRLGI